MPSNCGQARTRRRHCRDFVSSARPTRLPRNGPSHSSGAATPRRRTGRSIPEPMKGTPGTVYLVGAGPGAPDLLTLRAAEVLKRADIVFHDALVHPEVLALAAQGRKVAVGKRSGRYATAQQFINKRLVDAARAYR